MAKIPWNKKMIPQIANVHPVGVTSVWYFSESAALSGKPKMDEAEKVTRMLMM
jgi:hypothetical protein